MNPTTILAIYNFRMRTSLLRLLWNIALNRGMADYSPTGPGTLTTGQVGGLWRDRAITVKNPVSPLDSSLSSCSEEHCSSQEYPVSKVA